LQSLAETGPLLATATNRQAGDEGLILFDLGKKHGAALPRSGRLRARGQSSGAACDAEADGAGYQAGG
jgi:hypothetical protein